MVRQLLNGCQTSNVLRRNMSRSLESRQSGLRKQHTKITFAAGERTLKRFKIIIIGDGDSLSWLILFCEYTKLRFPSAAFQCAVRLPITCLSSAN